MQPAERLAPIPTGPAIRVLPGGLPTGAAARPAAPSRRRVETVMMGVQDQITDFFQAFEPNQRFREDPWERPGGGGGKTRVLAEGRVFEKVGVNRSAVFGVVPPQLREHLEAERPYAGAVRNFYATGVSVVAHPRSPMVPIVHLNVRFFELTGRGGRPLDAWFGGGIDMTPTHPHPADAAFFHRGLKELCDRYDRGLYGDFKAACDEYFVNRHRACEARGIGGLFFDHMRGDGSGPLTWPRLLSFVKDVGLGLPDVYGPVVSRRQRLPYGERERAFQLRRRARYVEFNLVHDRGTRFGLQTDGRIESVLMSLPPLAAWTYDDGSETPAPFEAAFMDMLRPRDWASWTGDVD